MAESAVVVGNGNGNGNGTEATPPAPGFWPTVKLNVNRPSLRLSSEFDSESSVFLHKVSCKVLDSLAKLKLSFHHELTGADGSLSRPQLSLVSKHLSVHHDFQDNNTLLSATLDLSPERLQLRASHDLKSQQGDLSLLATLPNPNYSIHLSTPLPPPSALALPKATFKFPLGELCLEEQQDLDDDANTAQALSVNGIVKANLLNGLCSAQYADDHCNLRYSFKDDQMAFIPSISLPSNALSFAFKRRFSPCHKLSYWYNFDVNNWSAVYKHTYGKDLKLKAGYDSEVRIGWASLWVGEENGKAKAAPLKMKIQFMLQVPQDDIKSSALMFRVKKRWDI